MEKKKVSLTVFLGIVAIIVIGVLACYLVILQQKQADTTQQVKQLASDLQKTQEQLQAAEQEKNELQGKISTVNDVITSNQKFTGSDLVMDTLKMGMTLEEVTNSIGQYEDKKEYTEGISGEDIIELKYDNGNTTVWLRNGKVENVVSRATNRTFSRKIKIGMLEDEVKSLFPTNSNISSATIPNGSLVYAEKSGDEYKYYNYVRFDFENQKLISVYISVGDQD